MYVLMSKKLKRSFSFGIMYCDQHVDEGFAISPKIQTILTLADKRYSYTSQ